MERTPDLFAVPAFRPDSVCTQPGQPGSSPACATCVASCSPEPADQMTDAEVQWWMENRHHEGQRALGYPGEPTGKGWTT